MILKIFTTYDSKAKAFMAPFYMHEEGMATRIFQQAVTDETHQFGKAPQDYTLFHVGQFDDSNATFTTQAPISLGNGVEFLSPNNKPEQINDSKREQVQPDTPS